MIKKRGFWRNAFLNQGNTLDMLAYLNKMSAKGLHVTGLRRFKNTFEQNEGERYIYAICRPTSEDYYSEVDRWERLFEYKSLVFYRKRLSKNHVGIKKRNLQKKAMKEKLWLNDQLKDGLLLVGKAGDEYIFEHTSERDRTEYLVDYMQGTKNPDEYLYEKALAGYECVSPSTDGVTYYFVRVEGREVVKGLKKMRTDKAIMKKRMICSFLLLFAVAAASVTALVFAINFKKPVMPFAITGASLTFLSLIVFLVFKGMYKKEKQRLLKEEAAIEELVKAGAGSENGAMPNDNGATLPQPTADALQNPNGMQYPGGMPPQNPNGIQYPGGMPPQYQNGMQYPGGMPSQNQNGMQYPGGMPPQYQNGTQSPVATPPPNDPFNKTVPLPSKSDDSEQWQYVDETDGSDEFDGEDGVDGVTFSPDGVEYGRGGGSFDTRFGQGCAGQAGAFQSAYGQGGQTGAYGQFNGQSSECLYGQHVNAAREAERVQRQTPDELPMHFSEAERIKQIEAEYQRGRFLFYRLLSCIVFFAEYIGLSALAAVNCVYWFIPEKRGHVALFVLSILVIAMLPVIAYNAIGSARVLIAQMRSRKNKGF